MATIRSGAKGAVTRGNRALRIALIVSLAAHFVALAVFPDLRESAGRQLAALPPLVARLVSPPISPPIAPAAIAPLQAPVALTPAPEARMPAFETRQPPPAPRPAAPLPPLAPASPVEQAAPLTTAAATPSPGAIAPVTSATSSATAVPPAATSTAVAAAPARVTAPTGADPSTIEQYRLAIITAGARFKAYPRVALDNSWTGTARVRLVVGTAGETVSLAVEEGSGHAVLDRAALEMVSRGKPQVPVPERLRGRRFSVEIPVRFELN